jgi:hypothetical protein
MSITVIERQAQGVPAGEVITKLAEDTYFMRVDNRVTQVPPSELMSPGTMKQMVDATAPTENNAGGDEMLEEGREGTNAEGDEISNLARRAMWRRRGWQDVDKCVVA